ncbi:Late embryogenesis abundant protein D-34 [Ananas comosus]|uniref:Late embryogenesis abundant protein D-34 n=1 Tax=Ananas comosus TaxID=4615 RepID=A0A199VF15_ANACO|nr:Late embryogenesis abundant protein D-34 [Ananas comosus]
MSQQQPTREDRGVEYGDVFPVAGGLAGQAVAPRDAAMMQSAENVALGQTQPRGPAAAMQSAAAVNEHTGVVAHDEVSEIPRDQGVTVAETRVSGARIVTEFVAGQAVGQYVVGDADVVVGGGGDDWDVEKITIGEALAATARMVGDQPVEKSDAAAIQAAEARATGLNVAFPAGVAAEAQAAADANVWADNDATKLSIGDVLSDAADKMPADKPVERDDAARVADAETRNRPNATARPGGVAASMAAAARLNRDAA